MKNFQYPEYTDMHYIEKKKIKDIKFDENYPYIDNSFGFKFKRFFVKCGLRLIVFPFCRVKLGLKIEGRDKLKKNKEIINNGVISCCNHVHMWDYICILKAVRRRIPYFLCWKDNITGESGGLVKLVGGIPIPDDSIKGMRKYNNDIDILMNNGGWLHIYPEGSMWEFYDKIRPFKRGLAYLAIKYNKPILPMAIKYRKASFIRRKLLRRDWSLTICIGDLIYPNDNLDKKEKELDLTKRCHMEVCNLAGINYQNNKYDAIFNNSKRID
ncbi:MAG: 1-acyl-sn-glycerol-3-phosphate acyltransferase [Acholeplasmatales bacterium]|nr:1-acyl-sn-glycerol-3-phosphate acyltransferase [Acholeplasmatales bacterium]